MAMYTQVRTTAGYVGLNALEYIMQTVSACPDFKEPLETDSQFAVLQRRSLRVRTRTL